MIFTPLAPPISPCLEKANLPAHFVSPAKLFEGVCRGAETTAITWSRELGRRNPYQATCGLTKKDPHAHSKQQRDLRTGTPSPPPLSTPRALFLGRKGVCGCDAGQNEMFFREHSFSHSLWRRLRVFLYFQSVTRGYFQDTVKINP